MKRIALFLVAILAANLPVFSTIHTVCNMPYSPGQFTTYQDAETAANHGDTIYVHGSNFSYGDINVSKGVVIVGAGFNPNKQLPMTSMFGSISIGQHNVQLIGLSINNITSFSSTANIVVRKCRFIGVGGGQLIDAFGSNWSIEGNIFDAPSLNSAISMGNSGPHTIQHNIFAIGAGDAIRNVGSGSPGTPSYILNNIFLGDGSPVYYAISSCGNLVVRNNIFYGLPPYHGSSAPFGVNQIEKNLTFNCSDNAFYPVGAYPNNFENIDPIFLSYNGASTPYSFGNDFRLDTGSPGNDWGTDGTDIGVFGGIGELFAVTGEPSIAEITVFDITSPTTVAPGGSLTISVISKRVK